MKTVKKAGLGFGLVNVAVKMYAATESHDVKFHNHHGGPGVTCHGPVGQQNVCKDCGAVVAYADIVKGVDHDGQTVIVTPDDLATLDCDAGSGIDVTEFVDADQIDPILYESTYFLGADKGSEQGYALLHRVLVDTGRVGIVRFTMRQRQHLGVLRVHDGAATGPDGPESVLAIHTIRWADEVRSAAELAGVTQVDLPPKMVAMAKMLVESMAGVWDVSAYTDTRSQRLGELVEAKAAGGDFVANVHDETPTDVSDLLAMLEQSVAAKVATKVAAKRAKKPARRSA